MGAESPDPKNTRPSIGYRILLVDDEPDTRTLVDITLKHLGFDVISCANAQEAKNKCASQMPDLALIDIQLPGVPGTELCKWIKEHCKEQFVPVVFLTCQAEVADRVQGFQIGADDYITKPFECQELGARVKALLRIKSLTDELRNTQNVLKDKEKRLLQREMMSAAADQLGQPVSSILTRVEMLQPFSISHPELAHHFNSLTEDCMRLRRALRTLYSGMPEDDLRRAGWSHGWDALGDDDSFPVS